MPNKIYITKSKAGHYTVTIKSENNTLIYSQRYISTLLIAQEIASEYKQTKRQGL